MSADNYYFVRKREDGKFGVSHRFASSYYADEVSAPPMEGRGFDGDMNGWTIPGDSANEGKVFATLEEAEAAATRRPDWIELPPQDITIHETVQDAVMTAHKYVEQDFVVEYGVCVQGGLLDEQD